MDSAPGELGAKDASCPIVSSYCTESFQAMSGSGASGETGRNLRDSPSWETELRVWGDPGGRSLESTVLERWKSYSDTAKEICRGSSSSIQQSTNQSTHNEKLSQAHESTI